MKHHYLIPRIQSLTQVQVFLLVIASVGEEPLAKKNTTPENIAEAESPIRKESPPGRLSILSSRHCLAGLVSSLQRFLRPMTLTSYLSRVSSVTPERILLDPCL